MSEFTTKATEIETEHRYEVLRILVAAKIAEAKGPIFTTNADDLFNLFLACLPEEHVQHYRCHCCRHFFERFGGLAVLAEDGNIEPLLWTLNDSEIPDFFRKAVAMLYAEVRGAKIDGVFVSGEATLGTPMTGAWSHFFGKLPAAIVVKGGLFTASQVVAEKKEDFGILCRGLAEYSRDAVFQAVRVLEADAVDRSEKTLGVAKWLLALHDAITADSRRKNNLIWRAVATAPPGWCHVKTTMIATLLDDIVLGLDFDEIKRKWDAKMHPLKYQRPTTVKEGNLDAANKLIEKMGAERSLLRRYATLADVRAIIRGDVYSIFGDGWLWLPKAAEQESPKPTGKPFDHLKESAGKGKVKAVQLPAKRLSTVAEFKDVLQHAKSIEYYVDTTRRGYYALVTAVDAEAPPIIQWDGLDGFARNPVTWFFRHLGTHGRELGLPESTWVKVNAIFPQPYTWQASEKFKHHGDGGVLLALEGARWTNAHSHGGGLFPEHLKSSLESIKPAIERLSQTSAIADPEAGDANGVQAFGGRKDHVGALRLRIDGQEYELPH